jgi:hypothetical protein
MSVALIGSGIAFLVIVVASARWSSGGKPSRLTVSISSSPSGMVAMTKGVQDFAARHGVRRSAVWRWAQDGYIVMRGGKIDVRATEARMRQLRPAHPVAKGPQRPMPSAFDPVWWASMVKRYLGGV